MFLLVRLSKIEQNIGVEKSQIFLCEKLYDGLEKVFSISVTS